MPDISLALSLTDSTLQRVEELRGSIPRDEFLRRALQLGLCDMQDEATRQIKEALYQATLFQTSNFNGSRTLALIAEPKPSPDGSAPEFTKA